MRWPSSTDSPASEGDLLGWATTPAAIVIFWANRVVIAELAIAGAAFPAAIKNTLASGSCDDSQGSERSLSSSALCTAVLGSAAASAAPAIAARSELLLFQVGIFSACLVPASSWAWYQSAPSSLPKCLENGTFQRPVQRRYPSDRSSSTPSRSSFATPAAPGPRSERMTSPIRGRGPWSGTANACVAFKRSHAGRSFPCV